MDFTLGTLLGFMAIGLAVIPGGYASSKAVGMVGRAGAGVITEDPDKFGPVLILQALPGTQGVYGFLTGLMIMVKMGVLGGSIQALRILSALSRASSRIRPFSLSRFSISYTPG
jgi:V/A-type H+-transporting ATPase subunit K